MLSFVGSWSGKNHCYTSNSESLSFLCSWTNETTFIINPIIPRIMSSDGWKSLQIIIIKFPSSLHRLLLSNKERKRTRVTIWCCSWSNNIFLWSFFFQFMYKRVEDGRNTLEIWSSLLPFHNRFLRQICKADGSSRQFRSRIHKAQILCGLNGEVPRPMLGWWPPGGCLQR